MMATMLRGVIFPILAIASWGLSLDVNWGRAQEGQAQAQVTASRDKLVDAKAKLSIERGLRYLAAQQNPNGSISSTAGPGKVLATTSLAGLAFLGSGSKPGKGLFGDQLNGCLKFVLKCSKPSGIITETKIEMFYSHAYALRFLAAVQLTEPSPELATVIQRAVDIVSDNQDPSGGWRYTPDTKGADSSNTACLLLALAESKRAGAKVADKTIDAAVKYLLSCQTADGGFTYIHGVKPRSNVARTAAVTAAFVASGMSDQNAIDRGIEYLLKSNRETDYYYFGQYYCAHCMAASTGEQYQDWYLSTRRHLLDQQLPDRSWPDRMIGPEYATANACIVLQAPATTWLER